MSIEQPLSARGELANAMDASAGTSKREHRSRMSYEVVAERDVGSLSQHNEQWEMLTSSAVEPSIDCEPWSLLPALKAYAADGHVEVVTIVENDNRERTSRLIGIFPLEYRKRFHGLPMRNAAIWASPHGHVGSPLLADDAPQAAWKYFLEWLRAERSVRVLEIDSLPGDGLAFHSLVEQCRRNRQEIHVADLATRPLVRVMKTFDEFLQTRVPEEHRLNYQRKLRRLSEQAQLRTEVYESGSVIEKPMLELLDLIDGAGKDHSAEALIARETDRDFMNCTISAAHERGRLLLIVLRADARAIAALPIVLADHGAFALRTAFDESWVKHAPGMLVEMEGIRVIHERQCCQWMDMCAAEGAALKRIWKDHRLMTRVVVPITPAGAVLTSVMPLGNLMGALFGRKTHSA